MGPKNSTEFENDPTDTGMPCIPAIKQHRFQMFQCDTKNCQEYMCKCCVGMEDPVTKKRFCNLCALNEQENGEK